MNGYHINASAKTITECEIDEAGPWDQYMIVPKVSGLAVRDALYVVIGVDSSHASFRIKGVLRPCLGSGFVIGHTVDGDFTTARTSLKSLKRLVSFL